MIFSYKNPILQKRQKPILLALSALCLSILKTTKNETIITMDHHYPYPIMGSPI